MTTTTHTGDAYATPSITALGSLADLTKGATKPSRVSWAHPLPDSPVMGAVFQLQDGRLIQQMRRR